MQTNKPTPEQVRYLRYFAENEEKFNAQGWTQNPLAVWHATHPEGTTLSQKALLWRVEKVFTGMKSQGWVTETHRTHHFQDDEVNTRVFEETLYRITERGKRILVESGNPPVHTRRAPINRETAMNVVMKEPTGKETVYLAEGTGHGRVVTLPAGEHQEILFTVGGVDTRYRRSRRPEVDGHAVFVPAR